MDSRANPYQVILCDRCGEIERAEFATFDEALAQARAWGNSAQVAGIFDTRYCDGESNGLSKTEQEQLYE